jgi:hypothetical protein
MADGGMEEKKDVEKSEPPYSLHGFTIANPMPRKRKPPLTDTHQPMGATLKEFLLSECPYSLTD